MSSPASTSPPSKPSCKGGTSGLPCSSRNCSPGTWTILRTSSRANRRSTSLGLGQARSSSGS
eukprot:3912865-Lingulodinium_polyedra.AAC.1